MRIIAGKKRGMKLISPKGLETRPIIDRVKESLFSVFYKYNLPQGRRVADIFSGVGSLGLEALSRGAEFAVFVEQSPEIAKTLQKNIEKAGFVAESKVIKANAFKIGAPVGIGEQKYDLVFVDPPYALSRDVSADSQIANLLKILQEQLTIDGMVAVRTEKNIQLLSKYDKLEVIDRRQWGGMAVTILKLTTEADQRNDE